MGEAWAGGGSSASDASHAGVSAAAGTQSGRIKSAELNEVKSNLEDTLKRASVHSACADAHSLPCAGAVGEALGWGPSASVTDTGADAMYVELASEKSFILSEGGVASEGAVVGYRRRTFLQKLLGMTRSHSGSRLQSLITSSTVQWGSGILAEPVSASIKIPPVYRSPTGHEAPTRSDGMLPGVAARASETMRPERPSSVGVAWYTHHSSEQGHSLAVPTSVAPPGQMPTTLPELCRATFKAAMSTFSSPFATKASLSAAAPSYPAKPSTHSLARSPGEMPDFGNRPISGQSQHVAWAINPRRLLSSRGAAKKRLTKRAFRIFPNLLCWHSFGG